MATSKLNALPYFHIKRYNGIEGLHYRGSHEHLLFVIYSSIITVHSIACSFTGTAGVLQSQPMQAGTIQSRLTGHPKNE